MEVTASIVVPAPPDRVWALLSDTSRYAEWVEGTEAVTRSDGAARVGGTYDEVNPILGPWKAKTHWTVNELSDRRQVHSTTDIPLSSRFEVIMEVAPEGEATGVTQTLRGTPALGPVGALFARLMQGQVAKDNRRSLDNLVDLARRELHG